MNKLKIITISVLIAESMATIASTFKLITPWQMIIITIISVIIMMIVAAILAFTIYKIMKSLSSGIPSNSLVPLSSDNIVIPKVRIDEKFVKANSDILIKNLVSTNPFRLTIFRISMELNNSIEQMNLYIVRLRESGIYENVINKNFMTKKTYTIDTVVRPDEALNFKFDNDIYISKLYIDELYTI